MVQILCCVYIEEKNDLVQLLHFSLIALYLIAIV